MATILNLKVKTALLFTTIVSVTVALSFYAVFWEYSNYRDELFFKRLENKAFSTQKLLHELNKIDTNLLELIERYTVNDMHSAKFLIFDAKTNALLFCSTEDSISSSMGEPVFIDKIKEFKKHSFKKGKIQGVGVSSKDYVVITVAYDRTGYKKLENLRDTMIFIFFSVFMLSSVVSYLFAKRTYRKIDILNEKITQIHEKNLKERLKVGRSNDEVTMLTKNFNDLLGRVENAFELQKRFIHYASHELRTPLASMLSQTEVAIKKEMSPASFQTFLKSMKEDQQQLIQLVNSLLLLFKTDNITSNEDDRPRVSVDECLYQVIDEVNMLYPEYYVSLSFDHIPESDEDLTLPANENLLKVCFRNLIINGCKYSNESKILIRINTSPKILTIVFENIGKTLSENEALHLFTPFFRGENAGSIKGFGLGLAITEKVVLSHGGKIVYESESPETNRFIVRFFK